MPRAMHPAPALTIVTAMLLSPSFAQDRPPATEIEPAVSRSAPALTGKERLGAKWQDEQRVNNCNVPPAKRGTRRRPDTCSDARGIESIEAVPRRQ